MTEIITLLSIFEQTLPGTNRRQLAIIITALLRMTGRVTMLGISRWADKGGSYQMVLKTGLQLVSKLRHGSALYFLYDGEQKPNGPNRRYGEKIDYQTIPAEHLVCSTTEKNIRTDIYQAKMLHKTFAASLNVVIIVKYNLTTQKRAHVVLFSTDLDLDAEKLIRYYQLRFQIEFNFRDAKPFWGLEDFMAVPEPILFQRIVRFIVSLGSVHSPYQRAKAD